ncbi:FecCD family ABC transporter permease [Cohnella fermenti]|uniref:Iron ABC transporter permease n=1 Tax=Cohnella fermenti TaxID=2565925 RepID=A0A4S4BM57_9BACL|nr:iron ABC transporter permease [Cohnella fermenti]THF75885.1 iron ABC transporter permease [Cohnella fermenti]
MTSTAIRSRNKRDAKSWLIVGILAVLIVVVFIISMNSGVIHLSPLDVIKSVFGHGTAQQNLILFEFRLPRILISIMVGAGLALSGCILQGITRNPLSDPGILGINAGAGLMVVLFVSFYQSNTAAPIFLLPVLALIGAFATAGLLLAMAYKRGEGVVPSRLVLVGIAIGSGISSAMIVLTIKLSPEQYQFVQTWLAGSIVGANWKYVIAVVPWLCVLVPYVLLKARTLNVLSLGEQLATGLGARTNRDRGLLVLAAVALAGVCVAVGGGISFVGLIGPHLARRLVGSKHQVLIPASALTGGLLLLAADTIGRVAIQPSSMPAGIVVAIIGAPYFLYLMTRMKKG